MNKICVLLAAVILSGCGDNKPEIVCHDRSVRQIVACGWSWHMGCQSCIVLFSDGEQVEACQPIEAQAHRVCK